MNKEYIEECLFKIQQKYDVYVLLAVESGSRAWGFASEDSDWDVRFIYQHKASWYFSIDENRDVIEEMFENDIDAVGWDLKKALFQLKRSNPALIEWINSPVVYYRDDFFMLKLTPLARFCFNPTKAMYHYQRIYVKHDERYLQKQGYPMKRFMYYLRGILACQWIEKYKTMPPVAFQQLYEDIAEDEKIKFNHGVGSSDHFCQEIRPSWYLSRHNYWWYAYSGAKIQTYSQTSKYYPRKMISRTDPVILSTKS